MAISSKSNSGISISHKLQERLLEVSADLEEVNNQLTLELGTMLHTTKNFNRIHWVQHVLALIAEKYS